jgi:group I intron endonuclease
MKCGSGIYKFENLITKKVYVGSASYLGTRRRHHLAALRSGSHYNAKWQNAWDKYGAENFAYTVIEYVADKSQLRVREQYWMDALDAVKSGYNILPTAGSMLNFKLSESAKAKISAAHTGRKWTEAQKKNLSAAKMGGKQSPEQAVRHSKFMTGRKPSAEHLAAQIDAVRRPETRAKISAGSKGRAKSEAHVAKIKEALARPEVKLKLLARRNHNLGRKITPEMKAHLSKKAKERWANPEQRAKFVAIRRSRVT